MGEIIELLKNMEMQIKELSAILDCKNGTIASLAKVRDELKEENKKLKEKLEKILNFCKTLEDVKEEYMRIQLIKEIIEDKKDIHYYLEQDEEMKDE